ncbi:sterol desaturase family protein [Bacteroidota bacterium]
MALHEVIVGLVEGLKMPFTYLIDTEQRVHFLYLFSSVVLAYYVYRSTKQKVSFTSYFFDKKVWLSQSAFVDYGLLFFNGVFKVFLIGPYLVLGFYLAHRIEGFLPSIFGYPNGSMSVMATIVWYTIALTLLGDFATYVVHYFMHRIPFFWEFHKIHHAATVLNPFTQYRIHPVELIINNAKGILVFGLITGLFQYLSVNPIEQITFIGANVLSFAFLFFGANLRHSHVPLKYFNWIEYVFISPYQHQIHHSDNPLHFNKNIGSKLAIWDWMFGTLIKSKEVNQIKFGIGEVEKPRYNSTFKNLYMPFRNLVSSIFRK